MKRALLVFALLGSLWAQPDAPQPQPQHTCGPHWMGGCWNYDQKFPTTREVFKSPRWWGPTLAVGGSLAFDGFATQTRQSHSCGEAQEFGRLQSASETARNLGIQFGVIGGLGFLATKAKFPKWIYFGAATYATEEHIRAGVKWYTQCP